MIGGLGIEGGNSRGLVIGGGPKGSVSIGPFCGGSTTSCGGHSKSQGGGCHSGSGCAHTS